MARLYREAPLNGIWEGTGNVICLDVIRGCSGSPSRRRLPRRAAAGADRRFDALSGELARRLADLPSAEGQARRTVEMMALALQPALLLRHSRGRGCVLRHPYRWRLGPRLRHPAGGSREDAIIERMRIAPGPT